MSAARWRISGDNFKAEAAAAMAEKKMRRHDLTG